MASFPAFSRFLLRHQHPLLPCAPVRPIIAAAAVRSFSSSSASASAADGEHWTAKYRLRLGIGDSPLVLRRPQGWNPPKHGEIKIHFLAFTYMFDDTRNNDAVFDTRIFLGIALNFSLDVCGFNAGPIRYESNLGMELYALRAAGNMGRALKDEGIHDGPVVYEADLALVVVCLDKHCRDEREALVKEFMPEGLEEVDANFPIHVGDLAAVMNMWSKFGEMKQMYISQQNPSMSCENSSTSL